MMTGFKFFGGEKSLKKHNEPRFIAYHLLICRLFKPETNLSGKCHIQLWSEMDNVHQC